MQDVFEQYRYLLFSIAYRMLGTVSEAEDMVQEAFLRWGRVDAASIESPKAYLTTIVTRLCLDQIKSAQAQRETYLGPWLPAPLVTPEQTAESLESLSVAFLLLLEKLTPAERAVFLLREVFDYDYDEIAAILGKEASACRQLFSRAKKHIVDHRPRPAASADEGARLLQQFLVTTQTGDVDAMMRLLAEDVIVWSDGGGKATAATRPIRGRDRVARFILGIAAQRPDDARIEMLTLNGSPGCIVRYGAAILFAWTIDGDADGIHTLWIIRNPDKLRHLTQEGA